MVVFSGIQPTGAKHFGNYSGGFRQYAATAREAAQALFCVVDLHSTTVAYDPGELHDRCLDLTALLFATGLADVPGATVFLQSHVTAHAEANWLLSSVATQGELSRMTQFKEKGARQQSVSAGLFTYPVLMAGDILLYQADTVPVGDDQRQHVELARDLAVRFNSRFGATFALPRPVFPREGARIMDLQEPARKMATTGGTPMGTVLMLDEPDAVRRKFKAAVTDTGREVRRDPSKPGITNLVDIMSVATGKAPETIEAEYDGQGYGRFKADVAEAVVACLDPVRERYRRLRSDPTELRRLLAAGADKARAASAPTLRVMYERMGFVLPGD